MKKPVDVRFQPELEHASLIVGWQENAGGLGSRVIEYLKRHINGEVFCEIEPVEFFLLSGVAIESNVAQFPVSRFYAGTRKDIVLFESHPPSQERLKFLGHVLDVAQYYCQVSELYTVSGTVSQVAHTSPRRLLAVFNQLELQKKLRGYDLEDMTWEGPPAINSVLLWLAQRRGIPGLSLWPEVSFYLAAAEDLKAVRAALAFFDRRFNLALDFAALDEQIRNQGERLARLRREAPEMDKYIRMLEVGLSLSEEEQLKLASGVTEFLEKAPL